MLVEHRKTSSNDFRYFRIIICHEDYSEVKFEQPYIEIACEK